MAETISYPWWDSLKHGGLLISTPYLTKYFDERPSRLSDWDTEQLRRQLSRFQLDPKQSPAELIDVVLEKVCGITNEQGTWRKGSDVPSALNRPSITGESVKPRRIWTQPNGTLFPVFITDDTRLGIGKSVRTISRVLEWLRKGTERIAFITNGRQWRLLYAGLDHDAWTEWDSDLWFEEGTPGPQVDALRILLSPRSLLPEKADEIAPILAAIDETRKGQAEISSELGERVRKAVELLIQSHAAALDAAGGSLDKRDIYLAAVRMVMRMVIILFAEARDLLPRNDSVYFESYGLQGLREILRRAAGGKPERLREHTGAWPRVLGLFHLVHDGSPHQLLLVPRYAGELFRAGDANSDDGLARAVHLFENAAFERPISDEVVFKVLELITTTWARVRQGKSARFVATPVNFADLSSEYIGMLYEGLLGYELRKAPEGEAVIILNLGDQPALPLSRLEQMNDDALQNLVEKFKKKTAAIVASEDEAEEDEETEDAETDDVEVETEEDSVLETEAEAAAVEAKDQRQEIRDRAEQWAVKAVKAGKLVKAPKANAKPHVKAEYENALTAKSKQLTGMTYLPGEYYLVRASGTRKGSGTFYTRPALAIPTAHRTLRPLAYNAPSGDDGKPNELAPIAEWTPKKPEEILALKVCDPACGSASFLVAALRFLTDALYASLHHHQRISAQGDGALVTLAEGKEATGALAEETLPSRSDDPLFEPRLKARLRRYVVERCIYGVDIDALAIELARLALWIETMDRELPFEFLDHKIKRGNALIGTWFDNFRLYPILAWEREGGDKDRKKFVHHYRTTKSKKGDESRAGDPWNAAIKEFYKNTAKPVYRDWLDGQIGLWDKVDSKEVQRQHAEAIRLFEELHGLPIQQTEERAAFYRDRILKNTDYTKLKEAFDIWNAIWFWPPDRLREAPVATGAMDVDLMQSIAARVARDHRFFHWELEFPDVFGGMQSGFDAILGNPPWDISKPNSKEFFSRIDPLYRSYGKQEAIEKQLSYFERSADDERAWVAYSYNFKAMSNWASHAASPFGDGSAEGETIKLGSANENEPYRETIRRRRAEIRGYADARHPFRYQGSADLNLYKMFLEVSHSLLKDGGRLGMIAPSGVYTDKGTSDLRKLFLDHCRWRWLFGLENARKIFDIHRSYKFNPLIIEKGGSTEAILTAFMHRDVRDWEEAEKHAVPYTREQVEQFSPKTKAILEIRDRRDLEILEKIYSNSVLLGDQSENGWGIKYTTEFHMTNDSALFPPRPKWEEKGYKPDEYGRWIGPKGEVALPLYEGRMIGQFDFSEKGWVSGKGRSAVWREIPFTSKMIQPQYLMDADIFADAKDKENKRKAKPGSKVAFMDVTSATNARTMIAAVVKNAPCGNSAPVLTTRGGPVALAAVLDSFVYDFVARARCGGVHLNYFVIEESPLISIESINRAIVWTAARLAFPSEIFAADWLKLRSEDRDLSVTMIPWRQLWAITPHERLRLRIILDVLIAHAFGVSRQALRWILRDVDHPIDVLRSDTFCRTLDPKGFWRIEKAVDPEFRHSVLTLIAADDFAAELAAAGTKCAEVRDRFAGIGGDGWQLPVSLNLAEYELGHGASRKVNVRAHFGCQYLSSQIQDVAESWNECASLAAAIG
jgi:hypothetical protein